MAATGKPGPARPIRALGTVAVATLALTFVAALVTSRWMWGYAVGRPAIDERVARVERVDTITFVDTATDAGGAPVLVRDPEDYTVAERVHAGRMSPYWPRPRLLVALDDLGLLAGSHAALAETELGALYGLVEATGLLVDGAPGFDGARRLSGVVVEATGDDGQALLLVGLAGGEVSNDHYPYYELVFAGTAADAAPEPLSTRRFYFDIAGREGVEWASLWLLYSLLAVPITLLGTLGVLWWRRRRDSAAIDP